MFLRTIYRGGRHLLFFISLLIVVSACTAEAPVPTRILPADTPTISPTGQPNPTALPTAESQPTNIPPTEVPGQTPTATSIPPQEPITYTVQTGDTLISIAFDFGVDVGRIRQVNGLTSDLINVNQVLIIPLPFQATKLKSPFIL